MDKKYHGNKNSVKKIYEDNTVTRGNPPPPPPPPTHPMHGEDIDAINMAHVYAHIFLYEGDGYPI